MNKPFRLGIIGCGKIAARHAAACLAAKDVELTALVDPSVERAEEIAARYAQGAHVQTDLSRVVGGIDGAIIAAPNHLHRRLAVQCLEAGVPVLIEKPLAVSVAEGEDICRAAERQQLVVAVGYMTRFLENVQLMHHLLQTHYFGQVHRFVYQYGGRGGWSPLSAYNLDRSATGGGVLVVTGSHFLDRLIYWFGYPDDAQLRDDSAGGPEANAHARFVYRQPGGDCEGIALFSRTVPLAAGFAMQTERGRVVLEDRPDAEIKLYPRDDSSIALSIGRLADTEPSVRTASTNAFVLQIEDFARACRSGVAPMVSATAGLASMRLIEQLYHNRSAMPSDFYSSYVNEAQNV